MPKDKLTKEKAKEKRIEIAEKKKAARESAKQLKKAADEQIAMKKIEYHEKSINKLKKKLTTSKK